MAQELAQPTRAATISHLAPEGRQRDAGRVVAAREATSCFRRFWTPPRVPRHLPDHLSLLPRSLDLPSPRSSVPPPHGRVCRRRRSLLPRPPGLPRPSNMLESSATPSPSTPPSHVSWEAPQRPRRPHLLPRPQEIAAGIPTPSSLPRARFDDLCNHRELPRRNPLSPSSITPLVVPAAVPECRRPPWSLLSQPPCISAQDCDSSVLLEQR